MDPIKNCTDLLELVRTREKAHLHSRDYHKKMDQIFKISTLLSSTAVTYLVSTQEDDELVESTGDSDTYVYERFMTFTTTILSGLCTLLNSSSKAEEHGIVGKKYGLLGNRLEVIIRNGQCTRDEYQIKYDDYNGIIENAISVGPVTARKYKLRKTQTYQAQQIRQMSIGEDITDQEL